VFYQFFSDGFNTMSTNLILEETRVTYPVGTFIHRYILYLCCCFFLHIFRYLFYSIFFYHNI